MRFKLDENLGNREALFLRSAGHDVATVREEALGGEPDEAIFRICADEQRALITLDHHFGNVIRFPPEKSAGIVVLELPPRSAPTSILLRLKDLLAVAAVRPLENELWIVEPGRVRIHQREIEES